MKPFVYLAVLLLIIPVQASLVAPLSLGGIRPDLALALIFVIGLIAGPVEGAFAGIAIGLIQDIGSANLLGLTSLSRGIIGLVAGLFGRRVLDLESPTILLFLVVFSMAEGIYISFFLQTTSGAVPFLSLIAGRIVPQALYTGLVGFLMLHLVKRKKVLTMLTRRDIQKEL
ncbi:MAG TPA: rod shape-determining protein MreD [Nitrospirota bacterium]|nr:rod shape-determining protein MreD [Nitrospirota bacterium]